jgi:hypothetical protein
VLPRRSYSALMGRLLHDRTADKIAAAVSRMPRSAATIVPYDVPSRVAVLQARHSAAKSGRLRPPPPGQHIQEPADRASVSTTGMSTTGSATTGADAAVDDMTVQELARESDVVSEHSAPAPPGNGARPGIATIGTVTGGKVTVEGKVRVVEIRPVERNSVLAVEINDSTGNLTAMFYGRSHIPGLICGAEVRFSGAARIRNGQPVMINPAYELVPLTTEE